MDIQNTALFSDAETNELIFNDFCDYLLQTHHFVQYANIISSKETKDLKVLDKLLENLKQYDLPLIETFKTYFSRAPLFDGLQMAATCKKIENVVPDSSALLLYYVVSRQYSGMILKEPMYEITKNLLLNYAPEDNGLVSLRQVSSLVEDILKECNDDSFAKMYNKKLINSTADFQSFLKHKNLYDGIYFSLLPKYQDAILDDVLDALSNSNIAFYLFFRNDLGSGTSMGSGPLFQCNNKNINKIKDKCIQEREGELPSNLANMCPVFGYSEATKHYEDRFSDFFYWLINNLDKFKHKKEILDSFHANMGTYSWSGSVIPLLRRKCKAFQTLKSETNNPIVLEWIDNSLKLLDKEINREIKNEAYQKLV